VGILGLGELGLGPLALGLLLRDRLLLLGDRLAQDRQDVFHEDEDNDAETDELSDENRH
jgi:hypothetical protein